MNALKRKIVENGRITGIWISDSNPTNAEIAADIGFDFVVLDHEHGPGGEQEAINVLRAIKGTSTECIVRIPESSKIFFRNYLDVGVKALMIPKVSSQQQALEAVEAAYFPPRGKRGYAAKALRCSKYGLNEDYLKTANDNLFLIMQIEDRDGVKNAERIANTDGVDMLLIGPSDLSGSFGCIGDFTNPKFNTAIKHIEKTCKSTGTWLGTVPYAKRTAKDLIQGGYQFVGGPPDIILLRQAMKNLHEMFSENHSL